MMLTSLEVCSAVIEVAPQGVEAQLLDLVEQGFLIPVLGPALVGEAEQVSQFFRRLPLGGGGYSVHRTYLSICRTEADS